MSEYICELPFLWVEVDDEPTPQSDRAYIDRNATALVSNYQKDSLDHRSADWLGRQSPRDEISDSGLWNIKHVEEQYETAFLDRLAEAVEETIEP